MAGVSICVFWILGVGWRTHVEGEGEEADGDVEDFTGDFVFVDLCRCVSMVTVKMLERLWKGTYK